MKRWVIFFVPLFIAIFGVFFSIVIVMMNKAFSVSLFRMALFQAVILSISFPLNIFISEKASGKYNSFWLFIICFCTTLGMAIISFTYLVIRERILFFYGNQIFSSFGLLNLVFIILLAVFPVFFVTYRKEIDEEKVLRKKMEELLYSSRLNPHFLFNSLNTLVTLLDKPEKAEETILQLADLLRFNVDAAEKGKVLLSDEINATNKYLYIQKERFGERLKYNITESIPSVEVPPFILQPLVENSIKHNLQKLGELEINIEVSIENNLLSVIVYDNDLSIRQEMVGKGSGLTVTERRLRIVDGNMMIKDGKIYLELPV